MTKIPEMAKGAAAGGLNALAALLRKGAEAVGGAAALLRPEPRQEQEQDGRGRRDEREDRGRQPRERQAPVRDVAGVEVRGAVKAPDTADVPDVAHASKPRSHAAEHAAGTVADVVARIPDLSTDELRLLMEHESATKKRKGVLDAIEQAFTPENA
jgi:hypothetical protein